MQTVTKLESLWMKKVWIKKKYSIEGSEYATMIRQFFNLHLNSLKKFLL